MAAWDPDLYNEALRFAAEAHGDQTIPGTDLSYLVHLCQVCQEAMGAVLADPTLNGDLVMQCALLHDTIEDTSVSPDDLTQAFGAAVSAGVDALSKRDAGPKGEPWSKAEKMADSLRRIQAQRREVWVVKLADRITNLQTPPAHWSTEKIARYHAEAEQKVKDAMGAKSKEDADAAAKAWRMTSLLQGYSGVAE